MWLIALVVLAIIIAAFIRFGLIKGIKLGASRSLALPYEPAKVLFSPAERAFLSALDHAVGEEFRVFGKVRVADVARVAGGLSSTASRAALNRIAFKHFDFVVCRADDLSIVCAVELNDKSHGSKAVIARDLFIAEVCNKINLPLLMYPAKQRYDMTDIRSALNKLVF